MKWLATLLLPRIPVTPFRSRTLIPLLAAALAAGCGQQAPTTPSVPTVSVPVIVETYTDSLPLLGTKFYSFSTSSTGSISLTLVSLTESGAPSADQLSLAIGQPQATDCSILQNANAAPGVTAQVTVTEPAGVYCARIFDAGTLTNPATFSVNIAHPR
jgi:hypothetical protein